MATDILCCCGRVNCGMDGLYDYTCRCVKPLPSCNVYTNTDEKNLHMHYPAKPKKEEPAVDNDSDNDDDYIPFYIPFYYTVETLSIDEEIGDLIRDCPDVTSVDEILHEDRKMCGKARKSYRTRKEYRMRNKGKK
jgi:hypothetical protein